MAVSRPDCSVCSWPAGRVCGEVGATPTVHVRDEITPGGHLNLHNNNLINFSLISI